MCKPFKYLFLVCITFLTGCVSHLSQFAVPETILFQGKSFKKANHSQIDEMQQLLYLAENSHQDPNHWQQAILVFLDQNSQGRTLEQRAELRRNSFAQQMDTQAKVEIIGQELRSQVIYPPTERFRDVLLEVSRGRDLSCGYGQIQFSDKRPVSAKKMPNLTAYQAELIQLAHQLSTSVWQIECR